MSTLQPKPIFSLTLDGKDLTQRFADRLESLTLIDNRGYEADQLDIVLDDSDGLLEIPLRGVQITLGLGWQDSGLVPKGTFTVDEVEHTGTPDQMTIRARSADLRAGLTQQKERSWHDTDIGTIVRKIAQENSLKAVISDPLNLKTIAHFDQTNESDISFLSRIASMFDAIVTVKNGNLIFMPTGVGASASGKALGTVTITRQDGDRHRFTIADRDGATSVKALYQDTQSGKQGEVIFDENSLSNKPAAEESPIIEAFPTGRVHRISKLFASKASATRQAREKLRELKRGTLLYSAVVAQYREPTSDSILEVIITDKNLNVAEKSEPNDAYAFPSMQASADNMKVLRHIYANRANALRAAESEYKRMMRGIASFSINLAKGKANLHPELTVQVSGWKTSIDNTEWVITRITHSLTNSGFTSNIDLELSVEKFHMFSL